MWPFKKREDEFTRLWRETHPPITPEQRAAAQARLDVENAKIEVFDIGNERFHWYSGRPDFRDLRTVQGYIIRPVGYDQWGYPTGAKA